MSRLAQELPQIVSRIWALNIVDCLGGKSSANVMRKCVFSLVKHTILVHMFWGFWLSEFFFGGGSGKILLLGLAFLVKMYRDLGFVIRVASQKMFSALDFKIAF